MYVQRLAIASLEWKDVLPSEPRMLIQIYLIHRFEWIVQRKHNISRLYIYRSIRNHIMGKSEREVSGLDE